MIHQGVVVVLALRAFSLCFIFFSLSCTSFKASNVEQKEILIEEKEEIIKEYNLDQNIPSKNKFKKLEPGSISTIYLNDSDLWIGKLGGALIRRNLYTGVSKSFMEDNYSIKDFSIKKILESPKYILALQTDRIIKIDKATNELKITTLPPEIYRASDMVLYKGKFYLSTLGYGLLEYNIDTSQFTSIISSIKFISSLELDKNTLFIGSMNNGLYSYDLEKMKLNSRLNYPLPLFKKNITDLKKNKNNLWLGTAKNGLIKWNTSTNKVEKLFTGEGVSSIYTDKDISVVSLIGHGIYIESENGNSLESIKTSLVTNNITSVAIFNNKLITGNLKKGIIEQEILSLNDQKTHN